MAQLRSIKGAAADAYWTELGMLANNVYFIDDGEGGVVVVDPSTKIDVIKEIIGDRPVSAIFVTHGHHDHIGALDELRSLTGAPIVVGVEETHRITHPQPGFAGKTAPASTVDRAVQHGETIQTGALTWHVIHTPGHTEGGVCYFLSPEDGTHPDGAPLLMSGDTLFHGTIGRTDFAGGNMKDMRASLGKLAKLPDETIVCPGHNGLTTIGKERVRTIEAIRNDRWSRP